MLDPGVYLEKLSLFSRMLRLEGLPVSPRETADAASLLTTLGFEDRSQVKIALRTVYAKSREEQNIFDQVFDGFFVSEETMRGGAGGGPPPRRGGAAGQRPADGPDGGTAGDLRRDAGGGPGVPARHHGPL